MHTSRRGIPLLFLVITTSASGQGRPNGSLPQWTLSAKPTLTIGDEIGPQGQFEGIVGVARTARGDVVVGDGSQELRVFSSDGEYRRTITRRGSGPGEFRMLGLVSVAGDTVFGYDFSGGRFDVFTTEGFVARVPLRAHNATRSLAPIRRMSSGAVAVSDGIARVIAERPAGTIWSDSLKIGVLTPAEPGNVAWIGKFPSGQLLSFPSPMVPGRMAATRFIYGTAAGFAVVGDRLWVGNSDTPEVNVYDSKGAKSLVFRLPMSMVEFDHGTIERMRRMPIDTSVGVFQRAGRIALNAAALPSHAPLYSRFVAGDSEVWVEQYEDDTTRGRKFVIVDERGRGLGQVTVPPGFMLYQPGKDFILGVLKNAEGVESVVQYSLRR